MKFLVGIIVWVKSILHNTYKHTYWRTYVMSHDLPSFPRSKQADGASNGEENKPILPKQSVKPIYALELEPGTVVLQSEDGEFFRYRYHCLHKNTFYITWVNCVLNCIDTLVYILLLLKSAHLAKVYWNLFCFLIPDLSHIRPKLPT